jgi:2-C-methyl-D-erythritol 2,4-cyclodiphosphate synthase
MSYRIGFGVDYHQLVEGRDLWLGGVKIPHHTGAKGHSDAMLGAAAMGDIGVHFPDTSAEFKDIDSKILLRKTMELVASRGYRVVNVDSTLCLEAPKIKPYVPEMQQVISGILGLSTDDVSIKATTTETMGFVGRKEGLVAYASVLLTR